MHTLQVASEMSECIIGVRFIFLVINVHDSMCVNMCIHIVWLCEYMCKGVLDKEQITLNRLILLTKRFKPFMFKLICTACDSRSRSHIKMYGDVFVASPYLFKYYGVLE